MVSLLSGSHLCAFMSFRGSWDLFFSFIRTRLGCEDFSNFFFSEMSFWHVHQAWDHLRQILLIRNHWYSGMYVTRALRHSRRMWLIGANLGYIIHDCIGSPNRTSGLRHYAFIYRVSLCVRNEFQVSGSRSFVDVIVVGVVDFLYRSRCRNGQK